MKQVFRISFFLLLIFGVGVKGNAQTYTYDPTRPNCNGTWEDGDCWERVSNFAGCTPSPSLVPNLSPTVVNPPNPPACPVVAIVNHSVTRTGNAVFGSSFDKIVVSNNATLTITGNVTISANRTISFETINGGNINIQGTSGIALSAGTSTALNINGDNTGSITALTMNFANNTTMQVNSGGRLNISGNLTQTGQAVGNINIFGGQVNVGGSVALTSGISSAKTTLRIDTRNSGSLNVTNAFNTGINSIVEISGDESGSLNAGVFNLGNLTNLNLNSGGIVNVSGNFNQVAQSVSNVVIDGGKLNINGSVLLAAGSTTVSTTLRIDTKNLGEFNITNSLNLGNNSFVEINGDDSGTINTGLIDLGQRSRIDILAGGRVISSGTTRYNGNSGRMDVYGYFETSALEIAGGNGLQFNTFGSANVVVENDVIVQGNSSISFGGNSVVEIGGAFTVSPNANIFVGPDTDVFVCGTIDSDVDDLVDDGLIIPQCILPVDYMYIETQYSKESNCAILTWATSKEWENSRFEIERSVGGISDFVKVGEVQGMGWKDSITEYEYTDRNLPLTGGNIYYRIKQVDINGEFSLSKVMSVKVQGVQFTEGVWRAYPNPTENGPFRVSLLDRTQYHGEIITFKIIQPTAISGAVSVASENEMNEAISQMIKNVPKGVFVIEITWGQKIEHIKVLKK